MIVLKDGSSTINVSSPAPLAAQLNYDTFHVVSHPLIHHKMAILRNEGTGPKEFRELVEEIAMLLAYEATRNLRVVPVPVKTPIETTDGYVLPEYRHNDNKVAVVPILRAGLGMVPGILQLIQTAKVGHIGIYRDHETLKPISYYEKFPKDLSEREIILLDPMLATGGSAVAGIDFLLKEGARSESIKFISLLAAPEGVLAVQQAHPPVNIYTAALDRCLNKNGYIMPGLGDAGDRMFGTK